MLKWKRKRSAVRSTLSAATIRLAIHNARLHLQIVEVTGHPLYSVLLNKSYEQDSLYMRAYDRTFRKGLPAAKNVWNTVFKDLA